MKNSEEKWSKIDNKFGLKYIPIIDQIVSKNLEFLNLFNNLNIRIINELIEKGFEYL